MGTITLNIDDDVEKLFRATAAKIYGTKKGYLGKAFTEAIQNWVHEKRQKKIAEEALADMEKGYDMGRLLYKSRDELYDRRLR